MHMRIAWGSIVGWGIAGALLWAGSVGAQPAVFPGDGVNGPALRYTDHRDGTFTDDNTKLIWEMKDDAGGIHDVNNTYTWSLNEPNPDGTLFTEFLDTLNNTCSGDET